MLHKLGLKRATSLKARLLEEAQNLREEARLLPHGALRDAVLRKARHTEAAANLDEWLGSHELQPPTKDDAAGPVGGNQVT